MSATEAFKHEGKPVYIVQGRGCIDCSFMAGPMSECPRGLESKKLICLDLANDVTFKTEHDFLAMRLKGEI